MTMRREDGVKLLPGTLLYTISARSLALGGGTSLAHVSPRLPAHRPKPLPRRTHGLP